MSNNGWPMVPLAEVAVPVQRSISVNPGQNYRTLGVKWWGEGAYERQTIDGSETAAKTLNEVHADDLIINKIWVRHGSVAVVTPDVAGCCGSNEFPTFEFRRDRILPRWLHWYSKTRALWAKCDALSQGTSGKNRIRPEKFLTVKVPLPALKEQEQIVARIDRLAAKIEEAVSIRQAATVEADQLFGSFCHDLFSRRLGQKVRTVPLGEISDIRSGVTLGRDINGDTVDLPYLRVANVQDGYLDLSSIKRVSIRTDERDKWSLQPGDLLLTEGGDWDKLGRGTVWEGEISTCIHQNHIFRVRLNRNEFDPYYVLSLTRSPYGREYFQEASKQTTNLASINQRQLKAFPVFQLPPREQRRIIEELSRLDTKIETLKKVLRYTASELDAVLPSVLDHAFRGEL